MTLEEYHKQYEHDIQLEMYHQRSPRYLWETIAQMDAVEETEALLDMAMEVEDEEPVSEDDKQTNAPKKWTLSMNGDEKKISVPRGLTACLDFLRSLGAEEEESPAVLVYLNKGKDKTFAVGKPGDWKRMTNRRLSNVLGYEVFGEPKLIHKNKLRKGDKKSSKS